MLATRIRPAATALLALVLAGAVPTSSASPRPAAGTASVASAARAAGPASVTLEGRGYGHGRGMSQYGAQSAASEHGRTYRQILRFYYPGLELGLVRGAIRVLISADTTDDVVVRDQEALSVRRVSDGRSWDLDRAGARRWRLTPANGGVDTRLSVRTDRWESVRIIAGEAEFAAAGGGSVELVTPAGTVPYPGTLRSAVDGAGGRDTVNRLRLEAYLRGVVPREVPALWHPQAVQAQAVAARTYASYYRARPNPDHPHYDLCDTTSCQVYGGTGDRHPASDAAIRATAREVLQYAGAPAFTEFSSSNGGWTVAGSVSYQVAKQDLWDPVNGWRVTIRAAAIERAYPRIGDFRRLHVLERDGNGAWGGRVLRIRVVGARRAVTLTGDELRTALGLRSTWFRVV